MCEPINNLDSLITVAKRDNNNKRPYLIVNPKQGKHIPVRPSEAFALFKAITDKIDKNVKGENLIVISFAETATAIGAFAACFMEKSPVYIQTTREEINGADYIFFSESHSHASVQKLVKNGLLESLNRADEVVFIEDEITTGNTILGLVEELKKYSHDIRFTAVSILNGMSEQSLERFKKNNIDVLYISKSQNEKYINEVDKYNYNNANYVDCTEKTVCGYDEKYYRGFINPRIAVKSSEYKYSCCKFAESFVSDNIIEDNSSVLVLGTEEFMYPALMAALELEKKYASCDIKFHATTRSPILVSSDKGYPLRSRYRLISPYENERTTYVYNIEKYDRVFVLTDAPIKENPGINSVINALKSVGNKEITVCRWC
ncbi:phosphoribosyltransferase family protein [Lachnospiraceae bacterium NSJ-143]|nr:phosphoribosyltransferase family protein [Lachnospiraceae bacterium NSJ-143]